MVNHQSFIAPSSNRPCSFMTSGMSAAAPKPKIESSWRRTSLAARAAITLSGPMAGRGNSESGTRLPLK